MTKANRELTREEQLAIVAWLGELADVIDHAGQHEGHTTRKVDRCVICSCGFRYQA